MFEVNVDVWATSDSFAPVKSTSSIRMKEELVSDRDREQDK